MRGRANQPRGRLKSLHVYWQAETSSMLHSWKQCSILESLGGPPRFLLLYTTCIVGWSGGYADLGLCMRWLPKNTKGSRLEVLKRLEADAGIWLEQVVGEVQPGSRTCECRSKGSSGGSSQVVVELGHHVARILLLPSPSTCRTNFCCSSSCLVGKVIT